MHLWIKELHNTEVIWSYLWQILSHKQWGETMYLNNGNTRWTQSRDLWYAWWFLLSVYLTHWGRVMHICISNLTIIGPDNGLLPGWRQTITWTNAWILLIGPCRTNVSEILICIQTFSFKKMQFKMPSVKWCLFCLGLNVLDKVLTALWQSVLCWKNELISIVNAFMILMVSLCQCNQIVCNEKSLRCILWVWSLISVLPLLLSWCTHNHVSDAILTMLCCHHLCIQQSTCILELTKSLRLFKMYIILYSIIWYLSW